MNAYSMGSCRIFVGQEPLGPAGELSWHLSISHPSRYPDWDEIKAARYALVPDKVTMAMLLPPKEKYVNVHPRCFHLWEINDPSPRF